MLGHSLGMLGGLSKSHAADPDTERARALFEEAGELERRGQWPAAQDRLRVALRLRETPHLHYALGWALENDDKLLEAKIEYETAARLGRERLGGEEIVRLASTRLAELDKRTPIVRVHVTGASSKSSWRVLVDGREVVKRDDDVATALVNPGSHVVRLEKIPVASAAGAPGAAGAPQQADDNNGGAVEQMVYLGRSAIRTIEFDATENVASRDSAHDRHGRSVVAVNAKPQSSDTKAHPNGHKSGGANGSGGDDGGNGGNNNNNKVVPWVLLSGGVAFLAGGTALLVSSSSDADTRDAFQSKWCAATACSSSEIGGAATRAETAEAASYREEATSAADRGNTKQAIGFALGGVGIVSAAVGTILLLRDGGTTTEKTAPTTTLRTRARASAAPLPGGAFATAGFSF